MSTTIGEVAPVEATRSNAKSAGLRGLEVVVLLAFAVLAFFAARFNPVVQNHYLDPYVYTGYINNFNDLIDRYGLTYYSVRFGLILPGRFAAAVFGPVAGYFALRYALVLISGLAYWAFVKERYGRVPAFALLWVLLTTPFFARAVLWDHPDFTGVTFSMTAIALMLMERRTLTKDVAAGMCIAMAIHSNFFVVAPLGLYVATYAVTWLAYRSEEH